MTFAHPAPVTYRVTHREKREQKAQRRWQFKCEKEPLKMKESFVRLKEQRRERERERKLKKERVDNSRGDQCNCTQHLM